MRAVTKVVGAGIVGAALVLVLAGCGSDPVGGPPSSPSVNASVSAAASPSNSPQPSASATTTAAASATPTPSATTVKPNDGGAKPSNSGNKPVGLVGFPQGETTWIVSGNTAVPSAAVVVRNGTQVCWAIAEYSPPTFNGALLSESPIQRLAGTEIVYEPAPADFEISGSSSATLTVKRTGPVEQYTSTWAAASSEAAKKAIQNYLPDLDANAMLAAITEKAKQGCAG